MSVALVQFRPGGHPHGRRNSVNLEVREDAEGEFYHLVTLWKATTAELGHRLTGDRHGWIPQGRLPRAHLSPMTGGKNPRRQLLARRRLRAIVEVAGSRFARMEARHSRIARRERQCE